MLSVCNGKVSLLKRNVEERGKAMERGNAASRLSRHIRVGTARLERDPAKRLAPILQRQLVSQRLMYLNYSSFENGA